MIDLRLGDCLEVMRGIPDASIDAVITDPPYLVTGQDVPIGGSGVAPLINPTSTLDYVFPYSLDWIDEVARLEPKHWIIFCNSYMLGDVCQRLKPYAKIGALFVWHKRNAAPSTRNVPRFDCEFILWAKAPKSTNGRAKAFTSQILDVPKLAAGCFATERILAEGSKKAAHPTQKPIAVVAPFIERFTDESNTILDPFAGTGTTGVACVKLNRNFIGIEINPQYFEIAQRRIQEAQAQMTMSMVTA